jgi:thiamine-phosphate diphosphorylase/hydroxyethylthiazole kinase
LVQVREKEADTGEFLEIALKTQQLCNAYGVPVIINDRVDIALAINAFGLHIGQVW